MRHLKAGKKLGRNPAHRRALYRSLAAELIRHERIVTTVAKAKAVRPFVERLITLAKRGTLHSRRIAASRLGAPGQAAVLPDNLPPDELKEKEKDDRYRDPKGNRKKPYTVLQKLFEVIGPRFADRPGGYTRILKLHKRRLGDAGETAILELLAEGEEKIRAREEIAPQVEEEHEEEEYEEEQAQETAAEEESDQDQEEEDTSDESSESEEEPKAESSETEEDKPKEG